MNRHSNDPDVVEADNGCPKCGERRIDWLDWVDDDEICCGSCGCVYMLVYDMEDEE